MKRFTQLLDYVRGSCRVRLYKDKSLIKNIGMPAYFYDAPKGPLITMATKGFGEEELIANLLHEYAHFTQYEDGFMSYLDEKYNAYDLSYRWLEGSIELSPQRLLVVRNAILTCEYNAEHRAYMLGQSLVDDFNGDDFLRGAAAHVDYIKYTHLRRKNAPHTPWYDDYEPKLLSNEQLYAPLKKEKARLMDEL